MTNETQDVATRAGHELNPLSMVSADVAEMVLAQGNLASLTSAQRIELLGAVCRSTGLNPLTRPFEFISLSGKLTMYARKDATDQLRVLRGVSIEITSQQTIGDVYVVTARASVPGRVDTSTGAVSIAGLRGEALANAFMKAETKAKRRVTLSICGMGFLDESEIESIPNAVAAPPRDVKNETPAALPPPPADSAPRATGARIDRPGAGSGPATAGAPADRSSPPTAPPVPETGTPQDQGAAGGAGSAATITPPGITLKQLLAAASANNWHTEHVTEYLSIKFAKPAAKDLTQEERFTLLRDLNANKLPAGQTPFPLQIARDQHQNPGLPIPGEGDLSRQENRA